MRTYKLTAVIWKENESYVSKCPETDVASCGESPEEALENLKEAVELYLENAKLLGMLKELQEALTTPGKFTDFFRGSRQMTKLPSVSSDDVIRVLRKMGFLYAPKRGKGSHCSLSY